MNAKIDRKSLLGSKYTTPDGREHIVPVQHISIGAGALSNLSKIIENCGLNGRGILISDLTTWHIAGKQIINLNIPNLESYNIESKHPHCDRTTADNVISDLRKLKPNYLISCGAGTVTDLVKCAAEDLGIRFIAVATAPSMNGYTSSVVALTENGLKKTLPATPAIAMIGDLNILCDAPLPMIRAGLGDLVSKPVCNADWKLTSLLRDEYFFDLPFIMIADLEDLYLPRAKEIAVRSPKIIEALIEAIGYSGISMVLAGSSAPASGGEHLISHSLDMLAGLAGKEPLNFHGTQVGVGTLTSINLYNQFLQTDSSVINWNNALNAWKPAEEYSAELRVRWGIAAEDVIKAFANKHPSSEETWQTEINRLKSMWTEIQAQLRPFLANTPAVINALKEAECITTYQGLGLNRDEYKSIVMGARFIRNRFCLLDVLDEVGLLADFVDNAL